jgi:aconitate hydratase
MYLGVRIVIAKTFARMHRDNLVNFGLAPLVFASPKAYDAVSPGDRLRVAGLIEGLRTGKPVTAQNLTKGTSFPLTYDLSSRQREILLNGGGIRYLKKSRGSA